MSHGSEGQNDFGYHHCLGFTCVTNAQVELAGLLGLSVRKDPGLCAAMFDQYIHMKSEGERIQSRRRGMYLRTLRSVSY